MARTKSLAFALVCLPALAASGCNRVQPVNIGSKNFTEQVVLGEILAQHLEKKHQMKVSRKLNMGGTLVVHQAMLSGDIDAYPEYTGTALAAILKFKMVPDAQVVYDRVREVYRSNYGVEWMSPLGFDNSFAMVVPRDDPRTAKLETLSDAENFPRGWRLGVGYEFQSRPDGMTMLNSVYRLPLSAAPVTMDLGLLYKALEQGQVNMIAGNMTDGLLSVVKAKILKDDKQAFPPYQAAFLVRSRALNERTNLRAAVEELGGKINSDAMRKMNYEVDVSKARPEDVAAKFLREAGL